MKAICIIVIFLISFGFNAQKLKIYVSEVVDVNGFDSTVMDLINNENAIQSLRAVSSYYDLDLTEKTYQFFRNNELNSEGEISVQNSGGLIHVNFLLDEYNNGLIINPEFNNEQVVWFGIYGDYKEICKFSQFEIIKSL
jgi:hypothetical protein